jgi:hypothetical protein
MPPGPPILHIVFVTSLIVDAIVPIRLAILLDDDNPAMSRDVGHTPLVLDPVPPWLEHVDPTLAEAAVAHTRNSGDDDYYYYYWCPPLLI